MCDRLHRGLPNVQVLVGGAFLQAGQGGGVLGPAGGDRAHRGLPHVPVLAGGGAFLQQARVAGSSAQPAATASTAACRTSAGVGGYMDYPPLGPDDMRAARSVAGPLAVAIGPLRCLVEVGEVRALGQPVQGTPGGIAPAERAAELVQFRRDPERRARVGAGCLDERVDAGWP